MSNINGIFTTKTRPRAAQFLQFTGKNGKDIIEFADGAKWLTLRNGGSYIKVVWPNGDTFNFRKGTIFVREDKNLYMYDYEMFKQEYVVPKNFDSVA